MVVVLTSVKQLEKCALDSCYPGTSEKSYSRGYGEGSVPGRPHRVLHGFTSMVAKVHASIHADSLFLIGKHLHEFHDSLTKGKTWKREALGIL